MTEIINKAKNKELIVRKRISLFIEKIFRFFEYDFRHDIYKGITNLEFGAETEVEEKIKNFHDAFVFILQNNKCPLTKEKLKKFFYILYAEEFSEDLLIRLTSKYFHIKELPLLEKIIVYHLYVYEQLFLLKEDERTMISLMFINYMLTANDIPCIHFLMGDLKKYITCREKYFEGDMEGMFNLMYSILKKSKFQDKSFYENLESINISLIYKYILADEKILREKYFVEGIYIYGSYAKNNERFDSDIDLLVTFSQLVLPEDKKTYMNIIKEKYTEIFKRYVDVHEINKHLSDKEIKEFSKVKKIY